MSVISPWEAQMLAARGRLTLDIPRAHWLPAAAAPETVVVVPLDLAVVLALGRLPGTFHGDPADRIIATTARAHDLPLATQDRKLRRSCTVRI